MHSEIRPVRLATHRELAWKPSSGYAFASTSNVTQIAGEELGLMATQYVLGVIDGEIPSMVALLSLTPGTNLFVGPDGRWLGDYVPAVMRSYPFKLIPAESGEFALAFDEGSGLLASAGEAEAFFDDQERPTERVSKILQFLVNLHRGIRTTNEAIGRLKERGLLEPWPLVIQDGENKVPINGLLRVSESALTQLDAVSFAALREGGTLAVAYAQLISMANLAKLGRLANAHAQYAERSRSQHEDVASMFASAKADDDIDWDEVLKTD
ncbi:SapC [Devosia equisanguinis]|uniref:SapC n=1 Tax=Devosia equisanguinis TaxID=2490941 RepID=A0A3S4GGG8_9HYPH|nr:SapC family protein [Devosia equisanguinis]VDS03986.1 SapC [Devosia equisanguinis]